MTGATVGKAGYNKNPGMIVNQRTIGIICTNEITNKFLKHIIINTNFYNYCQNKATGPQQNISKQDIGEYKLIIPPLALQEKIVDILDKFDNYTNSIESGLKGEIEKNQKRYEYYRDLLLNFE